MTDVSDVMSLLRKIEATGVRAEKEELVEELAKLPMGEFAIRWAYDPFITFGIRVGRREDIVRGVSLEFTIPRIKFILEKLAKRDLTGNAAEAELAEVMNFLCDDGAELLFRILSKDLKCGVGTATLNKVVPGIVPTFCVMRAHKFEEKRVKKWPVAVEPKYDGFRYTFIYRNGVGGFFTRSGSPAPAVDHVAKAMMEIAELVVQPVYTMTDTTKALYQTLTNEKGEIEFVADGEMMAGEFNETSGALRRSSEQAKNAKFHIFDIMPWKDFDAVGSVGKVWTERRKMVEAFTEVARNDSGWSALVTKTERYWCTTLDEVITLYDKFRARKLEGAMVKLPDGLYDKKKSYGWLKIKAEETEDLLIVGAYPGEPHTKYEHCLGGLVVKRRDVLVRVGGGFSDPERIAFWDRIMKDIALADKSCVSVDKKGATIVSTTCIGISSKTSLLFDLAEVEYHEVTPDGSLRHPRFVRLRTDKRGEVESKDAA